MDMKEFLNSVTINPILFVNDYEDENFLVNNVIKKYNICKNIQFSIENLSIIP